MTERLPQSRKLELNGYLTKPTTRLGRYNLLLREILKHTPANHPDHEYIPKAMDVISEFLSDVNHETGKIESRFNIRLLIEKLSYKAPISVDDRFTVSNSLIINLVGWLFVTHLGSKFIKRKLMDDMSLFLEFAS